MFPPSPLTQKRLQNCLDTKLNFFPPFAKWWNISQAGFVVFKVCLHIETRLLREKLQRNNWQMHQKSISTLPLEMFFFIIAAKSPVIFHLMVKRKEKNNDDSKWKKNWQEMMITEFVAAAVLDQLPFICGFICGNIFVPAAATKCSFYNFFNISTRTARSS